MTEKQESIKEEKIELKEGAVVQKEIASGFSLTGDFVANLNDKRFSIIGQRTELVKDLDNAGKLKEKCILTIQIADGTQLDYYPNKTSMQEIINKRGFHYKDWINFAGEFETASQKVGKDMKQVIYIKSK
jgi:hypothetical protein